jgi:hypothetical protein
LSDALPASQVQTQNVLATTRKNTKSLPQVQKNTDAIPFRIKKRRKIGPDRHNQAKAPPGRTENAIPYGQGGPEQPIWTFSAGGEKAALIPGGGAFGAAIPGM